MIATDVNGGHRVRFPTRFDADAGFETVYILYRYVVSLAVWERNESEFFKRARELKVFEVIFRGGRRLLFYKQMYFIKYKYNYIIYFEISEGG